MSDQQLKTLIELINAKDEQLKDAKKHLRELEADVPMDLEDLLLSLKDLRDQVKEKKEEHLKNLLENNAEYPEVREEIQNLKEEIANAKLELFATAANLSREKGNLDQTVNVQGAPMRLQTQSEVQVFLNGKQLK
ncbi:hypothetical protein KKC94_04590 [Patescibacteria group bacterium]|nr:hypothetical protein [Patescibacteria group bacterium]